MSPVKTLRAHPISSAAAPTGASTSTPAPSCTTWCATCMGCLLAVGRAASAPAGWPRCWPRAAAMRPRRPSPLTACISRPELRCSACHSRTTPQALELSPMDAHQDLRPDARGRCRRRRAGRRRRHRLRALRQEPARRDAGARRRAGRRLPPFVTPVGCSSMPTPACGRGWRRCPTCCCSSTATRRRPTARRRPGLSARRAHGAGLRLARLRARFPAPRPCCSTPMSTVTAAAARSSIGH